MRLDLSPLLDHPLGDRLHDKVMAHIALRVIRATNKDSAAENLTEATFCVGNFGGEHGHIKADRPQQRGKQTVRFIAEAAASVFDNFGEQSFIFKDYRLVRVNA